jgi:serine/threonine-protein kinase
MARKPQNFQWIGFTPEQVKLLDFGIAKMIDPVRQGRTLFRAVGSPEYAPPESFGMSRSDPRTDIYALGASMYFALTGVAPPQAADRIIRQTRLLNIRSLNPSVSDSLQGAIQQMMSVKAADRPDNVAMIRSMLDGLQPRPTTPTIQPPALVLTSPEGDKPVGETVHHIPPEHLHPLPPPQPPVEETPAPVVALTAPAAEPVQVVSPLSAAVLVAWSILMFLLGWACGLHG